MPNVTTDLSFKAGTAMPTAVLQAAITGYSDEAYTTAKKLSGTGIVGSNPNIDTKTETFIGQMRWFKPIADTKVTVASLTDAAPGVGASYASDYSTYIKTVRTHGASQVNLQSVITQVDGLAKIGRDFAETRAQDEHDALLAILKGVAISEAVVGMAIGSGTTGTGGQTFSSDPTDATKGFYVDNSNAALVVAASASLQGAARAESFINAIGMAWKDYEPEYAYVVVSPEVMASLRSANLVDQDGVQEANIMFSTIFGGKFRLIQTRASQGFTAAQHTKLRTGAGVDLANATDASIKTSFIILPGSIAMEPLSIEVPTEIFRDGRAYNGGGSTDIWHRWGYVAHPAGYDWAGAATAFPSNANYMQVVESGTQKDLTAATNVLAATSGVWKRKTTSVLSLGILPVFHS